MRLRRLDLVRYGKFTDRSLDFGRRPERGPDLHLVYGPNEAGKSTTISAWLDLLYGIETRSAFNFLHDYPTMLVGAAVEMDGGVRELRRVKKNSGSLRDEHDAPLPEAAVLGPLGGIDRTAYCTMFSLDDDTLEKGGNAILASKGELGQLLFSASAGLADMSAQLEAVGERAELFYRANGRNTELAQLKAELQRLRQERDAIDMAAARYAGLVKERDKAREAYEEAQRLRDAVQGELLKDQKLLAALPQWLACRRKQAELDARPRAMAFPEAWTALLPGLQKDEPALAAEKAALDTAIAGLAEDLDRLDEDVGLIALSSRVADAKIWRGRFVTAVDDLPGRRQALQGASATVTDLLASLGCQGRDPAELRLDGVTVGTLRRLVESHSGILARREEAEREHAEERDRLAALAAGKTAAQDEPTAPPEAWTVLEASLESVEASDHETRLRLAAGARDEAAQRLPTLLAATAPWRGDWPALAALAMPDASRIDALRREAGEAERGVLDARKTVRRLTAERDALIARIEATGRADGLLTDAEIGALRTERERAWAAHRAALDGTTAAVFEDLLRRDDLARDNRVAHADRIGGLRQLVADEAQKAADLRAAEAALARAEDEARKSRGALAACLAGLGLPDDLGVDALAGFADARRRGLEAWDTMRRHEAEAARAAAEAAALRTDLAQALSLCGIRIDGDLSLATLQRMAKARLEARSQALDAQGRYDAQAAQVERRAKALEQATKAETDWRGGWAQVCATCWFGVAGRAVEPSATGDLLTALAKLDEAVRDRDGLAHRIAAMEEDQRIFRAQVAALLADAGDAGEPQDPVAAFDALDQRIGVAVEGASRRKAKQEEFDRLRQKREALELRLRRHAEAVGPVLEHFGVETLAAAAAAIGEAQSVAREARDLATRQGSLLAGLGAMTMEEADLLLGGLDPTALELAVSTRSADLAVRNGTCEDLAVRYRSAEAAVKEVGADESAARLEEARQSVLAAIRDGAERWLRLSLGTAAARRALAIYRERHRGSMLDKASEAFAMISRNAYRGLTTQPDGSEEVLIAVDAEGRSKQAPALSKGTRFQLYLALRVAGYHEFARARTPVPFIADDIMETFDDFRAEETFRLFAGMAEKGQVIYFTHHRHLVDIARAVCPDVRVHEL
ncbi:AAA family ATPase [uncultured Alsobacter sp.]|uniref:AAA family ATPase n=1 Tax=uncultured Alsobacter sp. TaxID=1748258 RepID=UPI0025F11AA2|nr:AAA family ATPase [uncultured Alsobacter sp.]